MVVDALTTVDELDEAVLHLRADQLVAREAGDLKRDLELAEDIDDLLGQRATLSIGSEPPC